MAIGEFGQSPDRLRGTRQLAGLRPEKSLEEDGIGGASREFDRGICRPRPVLRGRAFDGYQGRSGWHGASQHISGWFGHQGVVPQAPPDDRVADDAAQLVRRTLVQDAAAGKPFFDLADHALDRLRQVTWRRCWLRRLRVPGPGLGGGL